MMKPSLQKQTEIIARSFLEKCVRKNYIPAFYYLGVAYDKGIGGNINKHQAEELFIKAAALDDPKAYFELANM